VKALFSYIETWYYGKELGQEGEITVVKANLGWIDTQPRRNGR